MTNSIDFCYHENHTTLDERAVLSLNCVGLVSVYDVALAASGKLQISGSSLRKWMQNSIF